MVAMAQMLCAALMESASAIHADHIKGYAAARPTDTQQAWPAYFKYFFCNTVTFYTSCNYICIMRNKPSLLFHQLTAIALMAVLFFVQGVKALHRHDYAAGKTANVEGHHLAAAHYCAICDYHLTKDAELPPVTAALPLLSCQYITYTFRPSPAYPGMVYVHANKGPPAVML